MNIGTSISRRYVLATTSQTKQPAVGTSTGIGTPTSRQPVQPGVDKLPQSGAN